MSFDDPPGAIDGEWIGSAAEGPTWRSTVMVAAVAAALTIGALVGWQMWSGRSGVPIDDRLPYLDTVTIAEAAAEPAEAEPGAGPVPTSGTTAAEEADEVSETGEVIVHVSGAVERPGVVSLPADSRVFEAIELVGGASSDADLDRINLAAPLSDGERIHVPAEDEVLPPPTAVPATGAAGGPDAGSPIDVNVASIDELQELNGVGPALAEAIVVTRNERGPFRSVDDLLDVPGIGEAKLEQLRNHVTVSVGAAP